MGSDADGLKESSLSSDRALFSLAGINEENSPVYGNNKSSLELQDYTDFKDSIHDNPVEDEKPGGILKCRLTEEILKKSARQKLNGELRRQIAHNSGIIDCQAIKRQARNGENPVHSPSVQKSKDLSKVNTRICKNLACKAILSPEDSFCKRCSCGICHLFDDNKDPSLWLFCLSETDDDKHSCGLSCHIACALQRRKAGCVELGQNTKLDGSYCCPSCGKITCILGCWKRQLMVAKEARRVDSLCQRIFLSYRLLDGTSRYRDLLEIVSEAKSKLETEVGPLDGVPAKMVRGIVGRLSAAIDVQKLCSLGIEKADELLNSMNQVNVAQRDSRPAASMFKLEDISSSSLVVVLTEASLASNAMQCYKLWYWKSAGLQMESESIIFPKGQQQMLISGLEPCTEYSFKIVSFTENGEQNQSQCKCSTKSEVIHKSADQKDEAVYKGTDQNGADGGLLRKNEVVKSKARKLSVHKVRRPRKVAPRRNFLVGEGSHSADDACQDEIEDSCGKSGSIIRDVSDDQLPNASARIDLNVTSVPDLNAEFALPREPSSDLNYSIPDKNGGTTTRSNGSHDSQICSVKVKEAKRKQPCDDQQETCGNPGASFFGSQLHLTRRLGELDDNYEYCVKTIRWLESLGHIEADFRMKFLTWFSLRSTNQERRVVLTYIRVLADDPSTLATQLLDSFSDAVSCKMPQNGFCSKLWH